jgi:diguanylate cyclase (GGDEF)-like protein
MTLFTYTFVRYKRKSDYDDMTETLNKTTGMRHLTSIMEKARERIAVCFIDIDGLKDINDQYGHPIGDYVILKIVEAIKGKIRKNDFLIRYGGDEFVIVISDMDRQEVENAFESALNTLYQLKIREAHAFPLYFSYGICMLDEHSSYRPEDAIVQADREMYKRKFGRKASAETRLES